MNLASMANALWRLAAKSNWRRFRKAKTQLALSQQHLLHEVLSSAENSEFALEFGLTVGMTVEQFQHAVPLTNFSEHYQSRVERIKSGVEKVLSGEPVQTLIPTTGSSGKVKLIPYTAGLKKSFQRVVDAWMVDTARRYPQAFRGKSYWAVTPPVVRQFEASQVPIGFESDEEYLSPIGKLLSKLIMVEAPKFSPDEQVETVMGLTALKLLSEPELSLVSVWSPTLLLNLLETIWNDRSKFIEALEQGDECLVKPPGSHSTIQLKPNVKRARAVKRVLSEAESQIGLAKNLWPNLTLVSCWGDAGSQEYFDQLRKLEPDIVFQPKGLLSTEGCVSFPFGGDVGHVPALHATFLEFLPRNDQSENSGNSDTRLVHQLQIGQIYEVVITTLGGLYRYKTGDLVEVIDGRGSLPRFDFVGRTSSVIDLVGEKVALSVIAESLSEFFDEKASTTPFWLVAPCKSLPAYYRLFIACRDSLDDLQAHLNRVMRQNPHYVNAESLGQLKELKLYSLPDSYSRKDLNLIKMKCGMQLGALKDEGVEYSEDVITELLRLCQSPRVVS